MILNGGSYFGQDEILKNQGERKSQAICTSQTAEIYVLDSKVKKK